MPYVSYNSINSYDYEMKTIPASFKRIAKPNGGMLLAKLRTTEDLVFDIESQRFLQGGVQFGIIKVFHHKKTNGSILIPADSEFTNTFYLIHKGKKAALCKKL